MNTNIFDRLSFWSLFLVIVLLPVFFLPFSNIPVEISKSLFLVVGLAATVVFWCIARFSDGKFSIPKSSLLLSGFALVFITFLSAIFSTPLKNVSLFGTMLDMGTFWFVFAAFLLMLFSSMIIRDTKRANTLLIGTVASALVIFIYQTLFLFSQKIFNLGVLFNKTDNLVGSWHSLGFFAGLVSLIILFMVEFFPIDRLIKSILGVVLFLSLAFVALTASSSFSLIWILVGIFALIIFVYKASISSTMRGGEDRKFDFPILSFAVVTISILFIMSGQLLGGTLSNHFGISNTEVSPTFGATMSITKAVVMKNPILGIGPNRFSQAWAMYKVPDVNSTMFWDYMFSTGYGLLPTWAATTGILGILGLLTFLILFLVVGVKSVFSSMRKGPEYKLMAFFVMALYLFLVSFMYSSGPVLILLAFAFTGVFIGFSSSHHGSKEISLSFLEDQRRSFFFMMFLIFVMIASVVTTFKYGERFTSAIYFRRVLVATNLDGAEASLNKAISLYSNDLYLRTYSQIALLRLNTIASKDANALTDDDKAQVRKSIDNAITGAQLAVIYDSKNYLNYQALGDVYQSIGAFGVKDANAKAVDAYKAASNLNPLNPRLKLSIAASLLADGKKDDAKTFANQAVTLKPDYVDGLITLSQIAKGEGDTTAALAYAQRALSVIPDNKDLQKYVDSIKGAPKEVVQPDTSTTTDTTPKDTTTKKTTKKSKTTTSTTTTTPTTTTPTDTPTQ